MRKRKRTKREEGRKGISVEGEEEEEEGKRKRGGGREEEEGGAKGKQHLQSYKSFSLEI